MCNLSENIERRSMRNANAQSLIMIMKNLRISFEQAANALEIDFSEREMYKQLVEQIQNKCKEQN